MPLPTEVEHLGLVVLVAAVAGLVTGLAGFGTALVAVGPWLHLLPPAFVPPLAAATSVVAQLGSIPVVRRSVRWRALGPYLIGAAVGTPIGVALLRYGSASLLRPTVGTLLVGFALWELVGKARGDLKSAGGRPADLCIGGLGGLLGGFAGLSAPIPVIWLRLRGGTPDSQRAIYQPFSLLVLTWAVLSMSVTGLMTTPVVLTAAICAPVVLLSAHLGARMYQGIEQTHFRILVLLLLTVSGLSLLYRG